jgi:hypothetical protein
MSASWRKSACFRGRVACYVAGMASTRSSILVMLALASACSDPAGSSGNADIGGPQGQVEPDPCDTTDCSNVIDRVVIRMLAHSHIPLVLEDDEVLCRRLAIDLIGMTPTREEIDAQCLGRSARDMADYFMSKPSGPQVPDDSAPYVYVNRRAWAETLKYEVAGGFNKTFYWYLVDIDKHVRALYEGGIRYDVFAQRILGHPAFARRFGIFDDTNHDLVQIASQAFRVFLGREALPSEAQDFGNLWRAWRTYKMYDAEADQLYPECREHCDIHDCTCPHIEVGLDGSQCSDANAVACSSTVLGNGTVIPSTTSFVRWAELSDGDRALLETPGKLIAAQPEFAEAAVDRALAKYLGWWKVGLYKPDYDIPAVRDALVAKFVADGFDARKMEREIVTSVLYTQAGSRLAGEEIERPIWAFGPQKLLPAYAWLDIIAEVTEKDIGGVDFRYQADYIHAFYYPGCWFTPDPTGTWFYPAHALELGDGSGLVAAVTRRAALAKLCPGAFAPSAGSALEDVIALAYERFGRAPSAEESAAIFARMSVAADGGCDPLNLASCDLQQLADDLCISLYASSAFNFY